MSSGEDLADIVITPRNDLTLPGVLVAFEKTHDVEGVSYETVEVQTAGDINHIEALRTTIQLSGQSVSTTKVRAKIVTKPATLEDWTAWLVANDAWVAALAPADWTMTVLDGSTYPNILEEGEVLEWMGNAWDRGVAFTISYSIRDDAGVVIRTEVATILKTITFTDCDLSDGVDPDFYHLESFEGAEAAPANFATQLYNGRSAVPYDGSLQIEEEECSGTHVPGRLFNVTGGRAEWLTMNTLIQSATEDIENGRTSISFGSPAHLGPDDLLYLLRAFRTRRPSYKYQERANGVSKGSKSQTTLGGKAAKNRNAGPPPGQKNVDKIRAPDGTKEIILDPSLMSYTPESPSPLLGDPASIVMQPREISLCINGVIQKAFFLCTEFTT
jgi:hypothetical protein